MSFVRKNSFKVKALLNKAKKFSNGGKPIGSTMLSRGGKSGKEEYPIGTEGMFKGSEVKIIRYDNNKVFLKEVEGEKLGKEFSVLKKHFSLTPFPTALFEAGGKPLGSTGVFADGGKTDDGYARIYVADLAAYNDGKLIGEWLDLDDYEDEDELSQAIDELMAEWSKEQNVEREEYAIHDYENIPSSMYSEYMNASDFKPYYDAKKVADDIGIPLIVVLTWAEDNGYEIDQARDAFYTVADDMEDYAYQLVEEGIITDLVRYISISETDRRIISGEEADARLEGMDDDDIISEAELSDELSELESKRDEEEDKEEDDKDESFDFDEEKEKLVEKAKEQLHDQYYEEVYEALSDPVDYFVDQLGSYTEEELAKSGFIYVDYKALARDLKYDFNTVEHEGKVYIFSANFSRGGSVKKKGKAQKG